MLSTGDTLSDACSCMSCPVVTATQSVFRLAGYGVSCLSCTGKHLCATVALLHAVYVALIIFNLRLLSHAVNSVLMQYAQHNSAFLDVLLHGLQCRQHDPEFFATPPCTLPGLCAQSFKCCDLNAMLSEKFRDVTCCLWAT